MHSDLEYDINILDKVLEVININNLLNFDAFLIKGKRIKRLLEKNTEFRYGNSFFNYLKT